MPPLIRTLAGRRQLIIWHADGLAGLEPESGKELWSVPHHIKVGIAISTPAVEGNRLAVSQPVRRRADAGVQHRRSRAHSALEGFGGLRAGTTMEEGGFQHDHEHGAVARRSRLRRVALR